MRGRPHAGLVRGVPLTQGAGQGIVRVDLRRAPTRRYPGVVPTDLEGLARIEGHAQGQSLGLRLLGLLRGHGVAGQGPVGFGRGKVGKIGVGLWGRLHLGSSCGVWGQAFIPVASPSHRRGDAAGT